MAALTGGTKLTDSYSYDAFGNVSTRTGTSTQPFQYLGNTWDSTAKLYDFHARACDPATGRFTFEDQLTDPVRAPLTLLLTLTAAWMTRCPAQLRVLLP